MSGGRYQEKKSGPRGRTNAAELGVRKEPRAKQRPTRGIESLAFPNSLVARGSAITVQHMRSLLLVFPFVALFLMAGCERRADVSPLMTFREGTLEFDYPKNWRVTQNQVLSMARLVQVEAPDSALAVVTVYAKEQDVNLRAYADSLMSGIKEAVPVGKVEKNTISGDDDSLNVSYSLRLAGVEVPHTTNITLHRLADANVICMTQVADEDRRLVQPGFDAIRRSLCSKKVASIE